jgi:hypothetical protein
MKKIFLALLIFGFFVGCNVDGLNSTKCLEVAQKKYPNAVTIPGYSFRYIARDAKGNVHYLEVMRDIKDGITTDVVIILGDK